MLPKAAVNLAELAQHLGNSKVNLKLLNTTYSVSHHLVHLAFVDFYSQSSAMLPILPEPEQTNPPTNAILYDPSVLLMFPHLHPGGPLHLRDGLLQLRHRPLRLLHLAAARRRLGHGRVPLGRRRRRRRPEEG